MVAIEERKKILEMINEGKITAEAGAGLLKALSKPRMAKKRLGQPRWMRVQVTDMVSGNANARVKLPLKLIGAGLGIAAQFAPEEMADAQMMETLKDALDEDMFGKIIDVIDQKDKKHVEIFIE